MLSTQIFFRPSPAAPKFSTIVSPDDPVSAEPSKAAWDTFYRVMAETPIPSEPPSTRVEAFFKRILEKLEEEGGPELAALFRDLLRGGSVPTDRKHWFD